MVEKPVVTPNVTSLVSSTSINPPVRASTEFLRLHSDLNGCDLSWVPLSDTKPSDRRSRVIYEDEDCRRNGRLAITLCGLRQRGADDE